MLLNLKHEYGSPSKDELYSSRGCTTILFLAPLPGQYKTIAPFESTSASQTVSRVMWPSFDATDVTTDGPPRLVHESSTPCLSKQGVVHFGIVAARGAGVYDLS